MSLVEKLSSEIGFKVASALNMDKDHEEIISYGAFGLIHSAISIILIIIIGNLLGVMYEALIITLSISTLRKYSGGVHASSPARCAVIGTIVTVGLALIIKNVIIFLTFPFVIILGTVCLAASYYLIYKLAPVDSPSKPIKKQKTKQRLKRNSIFIVNIFVGIIGIMMALYYKYNTEFYLISIQCIYIGILWQVFTLTSYGHKILSNIDLKIKILCDRRE